MLLFKYYQLLAEQPSLRVRHLRGASTEGRQERSSSTYQQKLDTHEVQKEEGRQKRSSSTYQQKLDTHELQKIRHPRSAKIKHPRGAKN